MRNLPARHPRYVPRAVEPAPKPPVEGSYYPSRHPKAKLHSSAVDKS